MSHLYKIGYQLKDSIVFVFTSAIVKNNIQLSTTNSILNHAIHFHYFHYEWANIVPTIPSNSFMIHIGMNMFFRIVAITICNLSIVNNSEFSLEYQYVVHGCSWLTTGIPTFDHNQQLFYRFTHCAIFLFCIINGFIHYITVQCLLTSCHANLCCINLLSSSIMFVPSPNNLGLIVGSSSFT